VARIFDAVRGPHFAVLLVLAALAVAAVPALADPGASSSGGASASSEVVVKRGDRGSAVRSIQQELGVAADGVFGAQTEGAVKRFQRLRDLVPDGIVGPLTRGALGLRPFSSRSVRRTSTRSVDVPAALERIAQCESGGNPRAISPGGQYRGKYQFSRTTWRAIGGSGDPADSPEWLQDRLALKLYRQRGSAPWPNCG
jgi:peptidoglycan hydrolase-like protein with peptidoglycan-binding domain